MHTHRHTHTWLSDATLEGGFNLMCLMLTLVARNTQTHPLFQPACHFISWDLIYSFHLFHFFYYYHMCSHLKCSRCDANPCLSDSECADWGSITPFSVFCRNGREEPAQPQTQLCHIVPDHRLPAWLGALIGCTAVLSSSWLVTSYQILDVFLVFKWQLLEKTNIDCNFILVFGNQLIFVMTSG